MTERGHHPLWEQLSPPSRLGVPGRTAVRADGVRVLWDDGVWRLCAMSGLWNANLGFNNRAVADAVHASLLDASFLSTFRFGHEYAIRAADALLDVQGRDRYRRVLFSTSGSAANDLTMKLARQHAALRGEPGRSLVVGFRGSYHGLTYGSHGLTGEDLQQDLYRVDRTHVRHVEHDDPAELVELFAREGSAIASVVVEPVLGSGAFPVATEVLEALDALRREHGFLIVADEVATGFGRTGTFFASERWPLAPDVLIASKGLTNGTCAAATISVGHRVCDVFDEHDAALVHGETQAGAPSTCAAILATIGEMERLEALKRVEAIGTRIGDIVAGLEDNPLVRGDGGVGAFRAVRLGLGDGPLPFPGILRVLEELRAAGVVVQPGPSCIQLVPAFVYEQADLDELETALRTGLDRAATALIR